MRQQLPLKPGEADPAASSILDHNADGKLTIDEVPSPRRTMFERPFASETGTETGR